MNPSKDHEIDRNFSRVLGADERANTQLGALQGTRTVPVGSNLTTAKFVAVAYLNHYYLIYILRYEIVLVVIRSTVRVIPRKLSELPMLSIGKASYHGAAVPCRMRQREMTSRSILAHGSARSHWHCRLASTSTFLLSAPEGSMASCRLNNPGDG